MDEDKNILQHAALQSTNKPEGWQILEEELKKIPALGERQIYWGHEEETKIWWCTFQLNEKHPNCFDTIYALGNSLNHFTGSDFQGAFYPTGPYYAINEDTEKYLEWMIDSFKGHHDPSHVVSEISMAVDYLTELAKKSVKTKKSFIGFIDRLRK